MTKSYNFKAKTFLILTSFCLLNLFNIHAEDKEIIKSLDAAKGKYIIAVKKQRVKIIEAYNQAIKALFKKKLREKALKLQDERDFFILQKPEIDFNESYFRPFNLTDVNWENGVSRNKAEFFVGNTVRSRKEFIKGKMIKFSSGEVRIIRRVVQNGVYLNIAIDGKKLSPRKNGYPNSLKVFGKLK